MTPDMFLHSGGETHWHAIPGLARLAQASFWCERSTHAWAMR